VGVGEPGVEREQGHLDREGERVGAEEQDLLGGAERRPVDLEHVEGEDAGLRPVVEHHEDDGDQHQEAAEHRVEEELDRRVDAPLVPPDPDQEVHRDQHRLPEHVEEEEVEGDEHPQHPRLQEEERGVVAAGLLPDTVEGGEHGDGGEDRGQEHEEDADAVHAQVVGHAEPGDPGVILHVLERRGPPVEPEPELERDAGRQQREEEGRPATGLLGERQEPHGEGSDQGQEDHQRQHHHLHPPRST